MTNCPAGIKTSSMPREFASLGRPASAFSAAPAYVAPAMPKARVNTSVTRLVGVHRKGIRDIGATKLPHSERGLPVGGRAGRDSGQQTAAPRSSRLAIAPAGQDARSPMPRRSRPFFAAKSAKKRSALTISSRDEKQGVACAGRIGSRRGPQAVKGARKCRIETQHNRSTAAWSRYVRRTARLLGRRLLCSWAAGEARSVMSIVRLISGHSPFLGQRAFPSLPRRIWGATCPRS